MKFFILSCIALFVFIAPAAAVHPDEMLKNPAQEARAREISRQLRCLVCQGEDIDESNAGLARDLRILVRERITRGDTDAEVLEYVQKRYGDYVLMQPPLKPETAVLWLLPVAVLLGGGFFVYSRTRTRRKARKA
jgi:cytochrome c-type biogenesis protein CcmH